MFWELKHYIIIRLYVVNILEIFVSGTRNGSGDIPDLSSLPGGEEMAGLWAQYHSALGLSKGKATPPVTRDQSVSIDVIHRD